MPEITAIILTYNESLHIARCIDSVQQLNVRMIVIDSYSTDNTVEIAKSMGAEVYQREWPGNQAAQFNWALENVPIYSEWVLRLDADEYLLPALAEEIQSKVPTLPEKVTGVYFQRRVYFMGKWIKHGCYYPIQIMRLWRKQAGKLEEKWMDEHVKLDYGDTLIFENDFVDENLNNLTWWINKHNNYASREALELLNKKYHFLNGNQILKEAFATQEKRKRWIKESLYLRIPIFVRPVLYFSYRYIVRLGILDGIKGLIWHFLQGFWYRFLIDAKIYDINRRAKAENKNIKSVVEEYMGQGKLSGSL